MKWYDLILQHAAAGHCPALFRGPAANGVEQVWHYQLYRLEEPLLYVHTSAATPAEAIAEAARQLSLALPHAWIVVP